MEVAVFEFDVLRARQGTSVSASSDRFERQANLTADRLVDPVAGLESPRWEAAAPSQATGRSFDLASLLGEVSGGRPLTQAARGYFEPRLGLDLSHVRLHTGPRAAEAARAVNARAFTAGPHIVFGAGRYAPGTLAGNRLLAHELVHVAQQRALSGSRPSEVVLRQPEGPAPDEGTKAADRGDCSGWERDIESLSKAVADHYIATELKVAVPLVDHQEIHPGLFTIVFYRGGMEIWVTTREMPDHLRARLVRPLPLGPLVDYDYSCPPTGILVLKERPKPG
jgi:hypothetical protein